MEKKSIENIKTKESFMKVLIVSKDHLGLNSQVSQRTILDAPYFTIIDYQDEEIEKVENVENELDEEKVSKFIDLIKRHDIDILICEAITEELAGEVKKTNVRVVSGQNGRVADIVKNFV